MERLNTRAYNVRNLPQKDSKVHIKNDELVSFQKKKNDELVTKKQNRTKEKGKHTVQITLGFGYTLALFTI